MSQNTLGALKNAGNLSEKGSKQGIESLGSMTKDPDMVNDNTSDSSLDVLGGTKDAKLSAHYPEAAVKVVSNSQSSIKQSHKKKKAVAATASDLTRRLTLEEEK